MKLPTEINKKDVNLNAIATELLTHPKANNNPSWTTTEWEKWLNKQDIYIFKRNETGFESWTTDDYARMMSHNQFEPYAFFLSEYVVMHDYC